MTFNSLDFIDDAVDSLDEGGFPYLILSGISEDLTQIHSSMDYDEETEEHVISAIREHFKQKREEGAE